METTERVIEFAMSSYENFIAALLDDPSFLVHPGRDEEPQEALAELRQLGADLGMDFDRQVAASGTEYERQRLADIESGKIAPMPREPV